MMKHQSMKHEAPAAEYESDDESPLSRQQSMLAINKCRYSVPVQSSIFSDRQQVVYSMNPSSYANVSSSTVAQIIFNSGSAFLHGPGCSIIFSVKFSDNGMAPGEFDKLVYSFGSDATVKSGGSALNIFREASITARSGDQLERVEYVNAFAASVKPFRKGMGATYLDSAAGAAVLDAKTSEYHYPLYWAGDNNTFEVPLATFLSFFGQQAPIPSVAASGIRLNLTFENFRNAFFFQKSAVANNGSGRQPTRTGGNLSPITVPADIAVQLQVDQMQLCLDQYVAYDSAQSVILAQAQSLSSSGLQLSYYFNYHNRVTLNSASNTLQVNVSAAKLKNIILRFRRPETNTGIDDTMASLPLVNYADAYGTSIFKNNAAAGGQTGGLLGSNGQIRIRIGSSLTTLLPIRSASQLFRYTYESLCDVKSGLSSDLNVLGDNNRPIDINASYVDWANGADLATGCTTIALSFERNALLGISGAASNNSRSISIELYGLNFDGTNQGVLDVWVNHLCVANVSSENIVVDK
jgi:hypothetical protein